jgi:hypothetical protein
MLFSSRVHFLIAFENIPFFTTDSSIVISAIRDRIQIDEFENQNTLFM